MIVGLTGGIATGKSTVTSMLRELGAYVVDADVWARKVVEPGSAGLRQIEEHFGSRVIAEDGSLNRPALATIVFSDETERQVLNSITHPLVRQGMKEETEFEMGRHPKNPVVWDVPLLFEGETRELVDVTVLVYVDESTQLERLMKRDGFAEEQAKARISSQMSIERKKELADFIINNMDGLDTTREQVQTLWQTLRDQAIT